MDYDFFLALFNDSQYSRVLVILNSIVSVSCIVIMFYYLYVRSSRIISSKKESLAEGEIITHLNAYLFENVILAETLNRLNSITTRSKKMIQTQASKLMVNLHKSYSGDFAEKLERLYIDGEFHLPVIEILKKGKWWEKQEAIRDLGEMNITDAIPEISKFIYHKHSEVRLEALVSLVKLKQYAVISDLAEYRYEIDEWMMVNLIHVFQEFTLSNELDIYPLFRTNNPSVILLGMRLVGLYRMEELWRSVSITIHRDNEIDLLSEKTYLNKLFA